jgi:hypothetical protein
MYLMIFTRLVTSRILIIALALAAMVVSSPAIAQDRFKLSIDGQEVTDTKTHLVWRRCLEGQSFDGKTCKGKPTRFSLANARKYASGAGAHWRIPDKKEVVDTLELPKTNKPLLDPVAFPSAKSGLVWALRPEMADNLNAWIVDVGTGKVYGNPGVKKPYLRLVRMAG